MADPIKDKAASSNNDAGAGASKAPASDMHEVDPFGMEEREDDDKAWQDAFKTSQANEASQETAEDAADSIEKDVESGEDSPEEVLDAVLEAEAAAIVDNAMDDVQAEAAANVAKKEAAEWKDKYMRLHAEWDTYRRRQKEQAESQKALAAEKLVSSLIPVIDDLERSISYAKENGENGLLSGVEAVLAKFVDTLQKDGVEVVDPAGEAFDALEAQAVGSVDDASVPDETVAEVYQKGYKIGKKVLRPAMVTVTTGGPKRPKEEK